MTRLVLPSSTETFDALIAAHSEPARHYHNVEHITHCLNLVDQYREQIPDADLVEVSFWFHDAIYDAQSKTNEEDSAQWAVQFLEDAGAPQVVVQRVYHLILSTKHTAANLSPSQQWVVDIDLAILGAEREVFDRYEQNIRLEYEWVPLEQFKQGRSALLEGFLARAWLFNTAACRERYEVGARANLRSSIDKLRAP